MPEYLFDTALIIFGALALFASGWLLSHMSDRSILRQLRPRAYLFSRPLTHDETIAERSLRVAFVGIILLLIGAILLMSGVLRLFGFGRG